MSVTAPGACFHCGEPIPAGPPIRAALGERSLPVCCIGCKAVAELIERSGLAAFYEFRSAPDPSLELKPEPAEWAHYDTADLQSRYVHRDASAAEATVEICGMYCSACVWLLDHALQRRAGVESLSVNPASRRAVLRWDPSILSFGELLGAIAELGFRPRPLGPAEARDGDALEYRRALKRLIVAAAAGMQVMMFAVALYAGDRFGIEGTVERFLRIVSLLVTVPIVFYSARPFYLGAWRGLRAAAPGMDLPVAIAITAAFLASVRAVWLDAGAVYFDSAAMFVLFLSATRFLEMRSRHRAEDGTAALARLLPDTAIRERGGGSRVVALDRLRVGDLIRVRPGDVIPVDGVIMSGSLAVDESMLTGEALPQSRAAGATVLAGGINRGGSAGVRVTATGAGTHLAEIGRLLERARADRPPLAVLADRVARHFVIGVLLLAAATGAAWLAIDPARAFSIVLATLVVTCPCALALATPAALAAAASQLAGSGFLLVRSRLLEILAGGATIVFDKTGTLTEGRPAVRRTEVLASGWQAAECLALAAALEDASEHVLARAFAAHAMAGRWQLQDSRVIPGCGVEARIEGLCWRVGRAAWVGELCDASLEDEPPEKSLTDVLLGNEREIVARFAIDDPLRADAPQTVRALLEAGFKVMIASGDRAPAVNRVAERLGVAARRAGLKPEEKVALIRGLEARGETVVMIGDGINDAPVLAAADASIAMDAGTALARASADAIVPGKRLGSVLDGVRTARAAHRIIRQNLAWAAAYNLGAVPLAAGGWLTPWMAALGMSLSSLVVVLNALRLNGARGTPASVTDAAGGWPAARKAAT